MLKDCLEVAFPWSAHCFFVLFWFLSDKNACLCGVVDGEYRVAKLPPS